jgi:DNA-directed RNA polymerase subunit M/transcription elongation factor TFIIS
MATIERGRYKWYLDEKINIYGTLVTLTRKIVNKKNNKGKCGEFRFCVHCDSNSLSYMASRLGGPCDNLVLFCKCNACGECWYAGELK